jgi:hypothetical protein
MTPREMQSFTTWSIAYRSVRCRANNSREVNRLGNYLTPPVLRVFLIGIHGRGVLYLAILRSLLQSTEGAYEMRMIFPSCLGQFAPGISTIVTVCTDPLASDKVNRTLTSVCGAEC